MMGENRCKFVAVECLEGRVLCWIGWMTAISERCGVNEVYNDLGETWRGI